MFGTHLQNYYESCLVLIYGTIMYHVWYSFTEQLYLTKKKKRTTTIFPLNSPLIVKMQIVIKSLI